MSAPHVGVKNGKLALFYAPDTLPQCATNLDRSRVQILRGGLRHTLLPLGLSLLQDAGVQRGDAFVLVLDNDRTSVACLLAAMELACVCVLVGKSRIALLSHVQQQTGIATVVVVDDLSAAARKQPHGASSEASAAPAWLQHSEVTAGGAVGLLTSGSIGDPKVVVCTWQHMLLQGQCTHEQLFPNAPARIVCATSISHAYSINAIFTLFTSRFDSDSELCFAPTIGGLHALLAAPPQTLQPSTFTMLYATPATYAALLDLPATQLHVDVPYCAGTRIQQELVDNIRAHCGLDVMQNYGSTETGDIAAWHLHGKQLRDEQRVLETATTDRLYVGSLWPGVRVAIDDATNEVRVATPWQAIGYVTNELLDAFDRTALRRTADVGSLTTGAHGIACLWLADRLRPCICVDVSSCDDADHTASLIAPTDIEAAATAHPDVTDALVRLQIAASPAAAAAASSSSIVQLRVVLQDDAAISVADVRAWCVQQLPVLCDCLVVERVDWLRCSPAGKLVYT